MQKYLKKIAKDSNGAKFYKVDLHFHSPSSRDQKYLTEKNDPDKLPQTRDDLIKKFEDKKDFDDTVAKIADKIVERFKEEHLNLVVVTDHNTPSFIDNCDWDKGNWYESIKSAINRAETAKKIEKGTIKVLPGVEITTARVHILAIFNDLDEKNKDDDLATFHISNLLSDIGFKANQVGEYVCGTGGRSVYHAIKLVVEYGGIPVIAHIDGAERSFSESEFKHKPKPASEGGEQAVKFEYIGELEAIISIPELAVMEYVNRSSKLVENLTWMTALKKLRTNIKVKETKGVKPDLAFVRNSDAHKFVDIAQRYSYVKMDDLSYNSFFYAFREPKNRVLSDQEGKPTEPKHQIDGLAIVGDFFGSALHRFNPRVNCMVGAVSSGKTTRILNLGEAIKDLTGTKETFEKAKGDLVYVTLRVKNGTNQSLWVLESDLKNKPKYWKLADNYKILEELQGKPKELKDFKPDLILGSKIDKETKAMNDYKTPLAEQCWSNIEEMLDPSKETPLIIDEMEQCLTDELIEKKLIPALEKCRKNRQIIIASCKSNIPIVLDAENIIIVNKAETVAAGSLEHKKLLQSLVRITEGGEATFKEKLRRCGHVPGCPL